MVRVYGTMIFAGGIGFGHYSDVADWKMWASFGLAFVGMVALRGHVSLISGHD